jgi:glycosyltransferase involved in cell wall biosynthesis
LRVVVAGAVLQPSWTGGEPLVARNLVAGLRAEGVEVITWAGTRSGLALAALGGSPVDWDPVSVLRYRRLLRGVAPEAVLGFYDYDTSLCRAATGLGIPYVACAQIFWPVCPIGILYIDGLGPCSGAGFGKCVRHMAHETPDSRLPFKMKSLPPPLGVVVYQKFARRKGSLSHADAIVVPSVRMANILIAAGLQRVHVVPDSIAASEIPYEPWSERPKEVLLPSASTSERKGLGQFVAAAERVRAVRPDTRFVATNFAGNSAVEGTPLLPRPQLLDRLRRAYVVVVPVLWEEPFGLIITEAMASGRPVVAYDSGAASEIIVPDETGIIVPRGNVAALSEAILRLLSDEALARRMGDAGRRRVVNVYSVPQMARGYVDLIRSLLTRKAASARPTR